MNAPKSLQLTLAGMTCGHCVRAVTQALTKVPGVTVNHVAPGTALIAVQPGVSAETLRAAVQAAGYAVTAISAQ